MQKFVLGRKKKILKLSCSCFGLCLGNWERKKKQKKMIKQRDSIVCTVLLHCIFSFTYFKAGLGPIWLGDMICHKVVDDLIKYW